MASAISQHERTPDDPIPVETTEAMQTILAALDDADCRCILEAVADEALSASEVAERCDLPLSTTYRKLDLLTEAGLLDEGVRIRRSGKHASEYSRLIDDVVVSVDGDGGVELLVS